ncbi:hypothetical protein THAOC_00724 [Thalassiosira oceanica]|uniref:Uncharacterized protein n=1 Tax=Thalassiosira oceanica TaxID=159749 RepID=K0TF82_THAOC|nr:hypothetical protein THAOC_00724 [Thalassiosira oceanica]|eukprot:EJK77448.1 hypothetical protein THAOC_00724 [Thalassiosira oceanica]
MPRVPPPPPPPPPGDNPRGSNEGESLSVDGAYPSNPVQDAVGHDPSDPFPERMSTVDPPPHTPAGPRTRSRGRSRDTPGTAPAGGLALVGLFKRGGGGAVGGGILVRSFFDMLCRCERYPPAEKVNKLAEEKPNVLLRSPDVESPGPALETGSDDSNQPRSHAIIADFLALADNDNQSGGALDLWSIFPS